jgi:hypothetical protein
MEYNAEPKYEQAFVIYDQTSNGFVDTSVYSNGRSISLCGAISQGGGALNRIGNRITLTSLQFKYSVNTYLPLNGPGGLDPFENFMLRCIVLTWRGSIGPTLSDILDTDASGDGDIYYNQNILSPLNVERKVLRKILYDKTTFHYISAGSTINPNIVETVYIPIRKFREVYYNTQGDDPVNGLYLFLFSNVTEGGTTTDNKLPYAVNLFYRVNFKDI